MAFTLPDVKDYLGITGTADDARITTAMNMSLALAEKYCNRKFAKQAETEELMPIHGHTVQLHRIPVETITSIGKKDGGTFSDYDVDNDSGVVYFEGFACDRKVTVQYTGGFDPIPDDLAYALLQIFSNVWPTLQHGAGAGGSSSASTGGISSITVPDVGTIRYATTAPKIDSSSIAGMYNGLIPASALAILDLYKLEQC